MSTTTFEGRLAEARHRLDEAAERLALLQTKIDAAEHSATVATALQAELRSWDAYLERLQASIATDTRDAREQAEAAIGDLRARRIELQRQADELSANKK